MSADKPPPLISTDPVDLRSVVAAILAFSVQGIVLVHALARPGEGWRWLLYAVALLFFVWVFIFAGRKMKERAGYRLEEERKTRGASRSPWSSR